MRYSWLWCGLMAVCLCLMTACSDDSESVQDERLLQVAGVTRAGETLLSTEPVATDGMKIVMYVTPDAENTSQTVTSGELFYVVSTNSWRSTVAITENDKYYLYGFMPASAVTSPVNPPVTPINNEYKNGANMTLGGLPAIGSQDVCVLVGVQRVEDETPKEPWTEDHLGHFEYQVGLANKNRAYLLMDHLYAALKFQFNVNAIYAGLRTIHLKEVTLKTDNSTVNATVQLKKDEGISSVSYSVSGGEKTIALLTEEDAEVVLPVAPAVTAIGSEYYCAPTAELFNTEGTHASIVCKYDIYDNNVTTGHPYGNLIRKDCMATNKLKLPSGMARGKKKILTLTVNPTYLYMLSEPDLDNPTIEVN
jgi:hypothetical protein